jgi:hypothetical protein
VSRLAIVSLICVILSVCGSWADDYEPALQDVDDHEWGVVIVGPEGSEVVLFGIPVGAGGMTAAERATVVADQRLDVLSGAGVLDQPDSFQVGKIGREIVIYVDNPNNVGQLGTEALLLTIDSNFGKYLGRNRWDIAYFWRDLMRKWAEVGQQGGVGLRGADLDKPLLDPAGRPMDPEHTWHQIPAGYRHKAKKDER